MTKPECLDVIISHVLQQLVPCLWLKEAKSCTVLIDSVQVIGCCSTLHCPFLQFGRFRVSVWPWKPLKLWVEQIQIFGSPLLQIFFTKLTLQNVAEFKITFWSIKPSIYRSLATFVGCNRSNQNVHYSNCF